METDLTQLSMLELFKMEADSQTQLLTADLLALERTPQATLLLDSCMRAAHSLKGAARIVGLNPAVSVTHAMEDCFVAAQRERVLLGKPEVDLLLRGVDLINHLANATDAEAAVWSERNPVEVDEFVRALAEAIAARRAAPVVVAPSGAGFSPGAAPVLPVAPQVGLVASDPSPRAWRGQNPIDASAVSSGSQDGSERVLRVTAQNFDRLLGLSAQSLVESRWLGPFARSLLALQRQQDAAAQALDSLREALSLQPLDERAQKALADSRHKLLACQRALGERMQDLDLYDRRVSSVAHRMYEETLTCRMRPFADRIQAFPRMLRDLAQSLGKQAQLEIIGESTPVDRDVLERLEAPLTHLLRNAVDHGIDAPDVRLAAGKEAMGRVCLEARQLAGMLQISVSDDGHGIDIEHVRRSIVQRGLVEEPTALCMSDVELYEFLFLPGFTLRQTVTELSGRGVGLDAVQSTVKQLRGSVRVSSRAGQGTRFELQLPLTLSVVRSLIVRIGGQPYAFPLAHIERTLRLERKDVQTLEGREHFEYAGRQIGLVSAHQILDGSAARVGGQWVQVLVVQDRESSYGLIVDRFLGVRELVVQALDPRLGKIKDISAGALLEDGSPVLIVDVDDLVRSIEKLVMLGQLSKLEDGHLGAPTVRKKRVLVVDDSFTVRELERKLIDGGGYEVEVAVDGVDAWNAVRMGAFDLVVTDVDMPRMDGIELVKLIKRDAKLTAVPVMIVSYKDRDEDKRRGLEAGADFYLAKGSFRNEGLLAAVVDLIGEAST